MKHRVTMSIDRARLIAELNELASYLSSADERASKMQAAAGLGTHPVDYGIELGVRRATDEISAGKIRSLIEKIGTGP